MPLARNHTPPPPSPHTLEFGCLTIENPKTPRPASPPPKKKKKKKLCNLKASCGGGRGGA